ncbi:MAG: hypothetical protein ABJN98_05035 [Roseibium sp.]
MDVSPNPAATQYLPMFAVTPGSVDIFFVIVTILLTLVVLAAGVFYFTLHSLPERMAHNVNTSQLQLIAILSLVALFTHNNAFWIAALLLAAVRVPDFLTPLRTLAAASERAAPPETENQQFPVPSKPQEPKTDAIADGSDLPPETKTSEVSADA